MNVSNNAAIRDAIEDLRASQKISKFESFDKIRVPDHTSVLDAHVAECLIYVVDFLDTFVQ